MAGAGRTSSLVRVSEPLSLLEFLQDLVTDTGVRDRFLTDPHGTLAEHGLAHLSPVDVHDALVLVQDTQTADFSAGGYETAPHVALAPPPADHTDAVQYLSSYLTGEQPAPGPDLDPDFGIDPDAGPAAGLPDDTTSFGAGDTSGTPEADPYAVPFGLDEITGSAAGFGSGSYGSDVYDVYDVDDVDDVDDDTVGDPYVDPVDHPDAQHHDVDF
jgi:hypothetical protein